MVETIGNAAFSGKQRETMISDLYPERPEVNIAGVTASVLMSRTTGNLL